METEGGSQLFETQKGKVMQMYARDHIEVQPQKKKEVLYLVKKKKKNLGEIRESSDQLSESESDP